MEALRWLQELMGLIVKLIPRPTIIKSTHGAVAFVRGKPRKAVTATWLWYWPMWTEVYEIPIVRQTLNLQSQALMCKNGGNSLKPIVVEGVVVYSVTDAFKAMTEVDNLDLAIQDLALTSIRDVLWGKTLDEIYEATNEINVAIRQKLSDQVRRFGVKVHNVFLSDNSVCTTIKIMSYNAGVTPILIDNEVGEE